MQIRVFHCASSLVGGVVGVAFVGRIGESAHVLEWHRVNGEAKSESPVSIFVLKPACLVEEVVSNHPLQYRSQVTVGNCRETASPCLPITNMSSSLSIVGLRFRIL